MRRKALAAVMVAMLGLATYEVIVLTIALTALVVGTVAMVRSGQTDRKVESFLDEQRARIKAQGDALDRRLDGS